MHRHQITHIRKLPGLIVVLALLLSGSPADASPTRLAPLRVSPGQDTTPRPPAPLSDAPAARAAATDVTIDLPCNVFDPGKADPHQWMSTSTVVRVTYDYFTYQYGYDPFAQSYDMMVSGLADFNAIIVQETVGVMAAPIPPEIDASNVLRVELWISVKESNLFPNEYVGITALESTTDVTSGLNLFEWQLLYEDARGFGGSVYFDDHLAPGAHALDLGPQAALDMMSRADGPGWFGVGFAADGWDLGGSLGEMVLWKVYGGGALPTGVQPFFRVYYNAPPDPFALLDPAEGAFVPYELPKLIWEAAGDPNGDAPIRYTVRLSGNPALDPAFSLDAGTQTATTVPFALNPGNYWWEVIASDPGGAERVSERRSFVLMDAIDAPESPARETVHLGSHPNPFNPRTTLSFTLPQSGPVSLSIFDVTGRRVRSLLNQPTMPAGQHELIWDGRDDLGRELPSGSYFAQLRSRGEEESSKLILVR